MKSNLILIGMRGSGKSHIGSELAKKMQMPFWDLDTVIEKKIGMSISHLVKTKGWGAFRQIESRACMLTAKKDNCIIATGGGAVVHPHNVEYLKQNGFIIWLKAPIADLVTRVTTAHSNHHRPSITGASISDEMREVYKEREALYQAAADLIFDSPTITGEKRKDVTMHTQKLFDILSGFDWQHVDEL